MGPDQKNSDGILDVLRDALDRPIAFHRTFVKLTGSVTAALMLSQAMYWSKRQHSNDDGWFFKTGEQWEEETGLSRFEQEGARKILKKFSFWKEERRGVPAKMYYRLDISVLSEELLRKARSMSKCKEKDDKNTSLLKTSKLDCGKPANKSAENRQTSMRKTSEHNNGVLKTTTETIKTTPLTPLDSGGQPLGSGRGLFEKILSGTLLASADPVRISRAAAKYARAADYVALAVDVLDQQYRQSKRRIDDVTALIVSALKDGVGLPERYIPRAQREAEAAVQREKASKRNQEEQAKNQAFAEAEMLLVAMPDEERDKIFDEARAKIHKKFRSSSVAVRSMAVEILMARARAPGHG